jgi:CheY-like chemotaxis protein
MQEAPKNIPTILIAEDDEDDFVIIKEAFGEAQISSQLNWVKNGEELLDYLLHRGTYKDLINSPHPDLILLDLNMPKKDGREALKEIKSHPKLRTLPIVILTTSMNQEDVFYCYDWGANSFIRKPASFIQFTDLVKTLMKYWFEKVELPSHS